MLLFPSLDLFGTGCVLKRAANIVVFCLLCVLLLALAACATAATSQAPAPQPLAAKARGSGIVVSGTLATVGDADELTAAPFTRLEIVAVRAGDALRDGRISVDEAKALRTQIVSARTLLVDAVGQARAGDKESALYSIAEANAITAAAEASLETAR